MLLLLDNGSSLSVLYEWIKDQSVAKVIFISESYLCVCILVRVVQNDSLIMYLSQKWRSMSPVSRATL